MRSRVGPAIMLAAAASILSVSAASADPAVWAPKEARFTFMGFTTHYSCDGLQDKMRRVLLQFGARSADLKVQQYGCTSPMGRPDAFPGVAIKMSVLEPAPPGDTSVTTVPATWKPVTLRLDRDTVWEAGDCELVEQIKQKILPLFAARNVQFMSNCVPHQLSTGGTALSADLLISDQKPDKQVAAK